MPSFRLMAVGPASPTYSFSRSASRSSAWSPTRRILPAASRTADITDSWSQWSSGRAVSHAGVWMRTSRMGNSNSSASSRPFTSSIPMASTFTARTGTT